MRNMPERDPFLDDPVHRDATNALLYWKLSSDGSVSDLQLMKNLLEGPILAGVAEEQKPVVVILAASRAFEKAEDILPIRIID